MADLYSGRFTHISGQLQVERRTWKVRRSKTDVLPLFYLSVKYHLVVRHDEQFDNRD